MSSTYAGNPANYPTSITIPSDGDVPNAASVNAALEGLADRTAAIQSLRVDSFTASGTWTCPAGVTRIVVEGCGGGGAGGCGGSGAAGGGGGSGSGGGGAIYSSRAITVVPTTVYTVTIGAGGTPSGLGVTWTLAQDGGDSTFGSLATFRGASGGRGAPNYGTDRYLLGGGAIRGRTPGQTLISDITADTGLELLVGLRDQAGGLGSTVGFTAPGTGANYYTGGGSGPAGAGGNSGANNTARGGGGGGASGAQGNVPGVGGAGGAASSVGSNGTAGTLGAGGGGGGGGGSGATTNGGLGGAGGSGVIRVIYIGPQAEVT